MLFDTTQRRLLLSRDRASGEPTHAARSGNLSLTNRAAAVGSVFAASRIWSWTSNAQAITSGARSPAQSTASLIVHAPGWVASVTIQLHVLSSGNSTALRSSLSTRPDVPSRASNALHAGHSGSRIS